MAKLSFKKKLSQAKFHDVLAETFGEGAYAGVDTVEDLSQHLHSDVPLTLYYRICPQEHLATYNHETGYGWIFEK